MKKKKSKKNLLKQAINYLKESRRPIYAIIILFLLSIMFGFINAESLAQTLNPILENIIEQTANLKVISLIIYIFQNNTLASSITLGLGVILGIFPLMATLYNGIVLGYVLERIAQISFLEWWRLLPHGIFEFIAIFISLGLGLRLGGQFLTNYLKYYQKKQLLIWVPAFITILIILITLLSTLISGRIPNQDLIENGNIALSNPFILGLLVIIFVTLNFAQTFLLFIIITFITNKELRKVQLTSFKGNLYFSLLIFILIILPLLIIAAIIEGILISVL